MHAGAAALLCAHQGWRFAFYAVAVVSAAAAAVILALGTDPAPRRPVAASGKVLQLYFRSCSENASQPLWYRHAKYLRTAYGSCPAACTTSIDIRTYAMSCHGGHRMRCTVDCAWVSKYQRHVMHNKRCFGWEHHVQASLTWHVCSTEVPVIGVCAPARLWVQHAPTNGGWDTSLRTAARGTLFAKQTAFEPALMSVHAQGAWARALAWGQEVGRSLWQVVRIRTFLVIVLQARSCMQLQKHEAGRELKLAELEGWKLQVSHEIKYQRCLLATAHTHSHRLPATPVCASASSGVSST